MSNQTLELVELARWLQRQIDEKRLRVVLCQRGQKGRERVREWHLTSTASELAAAIYGAAVDDVKAQRGTVHYGLFAYANGEKHHSDRLIFAIENSPNGASTALATMVNEDDAMPLERSQIAQWLGLLAKHTHASAHLALGHTAEIVRHYKEDSERKDARIRELEERHAKTLEMYEELLSMKHERELERLRAENGEKRKDQLMEKLDMLVPIAISKVLPAGKTPALGEELIRQFFKTMKREQLAAIVGHLAPEQAALIHEIYVAYAEREEQRDAKKKNGVNGTNGAAHGGHA
jgi:hypothetical protein